MKLSQRCDSEGVSLQRLNFGQGTKIAQLLSYKFGNMERAKVDSSDDAAGVPYYIITIVSQ